ncbi:MAG: pilin [Patescibacteria group bacterium]
MKKTLPLLMLLIILITLIIPSAVLAESSLKLPNPMRCADLLCIITDLIKLILGILGIFGTFMFVWGGYTLILSGGNPELVKKGKDTLLYATIGIIAVIFSWVIIRFVLTVMTKGTL